MSTPPSTTSSPTLVPRASRLDQSPSSSPSHVYFPPTPTQHSALSLGHIPSVHSSPGNSTINLTHVDAYARTRTGSYPSIRPHSPVHTRSVLLSPASTGPNSSPTPSVVLTPHHHDDREPSPVPTSSSQSPATSSAPVPLNQYSYSHHRLPGRPPDCPGDATPPNGVPRGWWWSRSSSKERGSSVSPSRGRSVSPGRSIFRNSVVPPQGPDEILLFPMDDDPQQENPSSSDLSLFGEHPLHDLDTRNVGDEGEVPGLKGSLLLSSSEKHLTTLASPTLPTSHKQTLVSLGVGIEEELRNTEIEHSFWPTLKLLVRSPKSPSADLGINTSPSETLEDHVISMENWDGVSLNVAPLSPAVVSANSSPLWKVPTLPSKATSHTLPGKAPTTSPGKGKGKAQDTFPKELSAPAPKAHSKHLEIWYDKFTSPHRNREGTKRREREGKENEGWLRARENVSLALNAVLPTSELARLSEVGKGFAKEGEAARATVKFAEGKKMAETENNQDTEEVGAGEKLWWTVKSTVTTVSPLFRISLTLLGDISKLTPIPGLHEAARMLLAVWEAVDTVETNRLQCLRLTERCATAIFSVRAEIADADRDMQSQPGGRVDDGLAKEMEGPVGKLNDCVGMVYEFLLKLNRRPFIKRFLRSDEIQQEIHACENALGDAMQMFGISIQIRMLKEFKRFARERHQLLEPSHQAQTQGGFTPPPLYGSTPTSTLPTLLEHTPRVGAQALPELQDVYPEAFGLSSSPRLQNVTLPAAQSTTNIIPLSTSNDSSLSPLTELRDLLTAENISDMEHDRALFHATLQSGINASSDAEMLNVLEVRPAEAPEALKALRRAEALSIEMEDNAGQGEAVIGGLEREFMESGIEALTRLSSVAVQKAEDRDVDVPWDLPSWTITRYEADRLTMIGSGSFSKVYLGSWSGQRVAIKVLSTYTSASLFRKEVEIWRKLRHDNVLKMWGASSAQGERPWFIVSEYCEGGSLVGWLRERRGRVDESGAGGALSPLGTCANGDVDLLRCMHHISRGMVYLHDENVLHGDLKAANVLVDDKGRCVISDFGQSEMKWEVSRRSGKPIANGTLRWQAPELLNGATKLTPAMDVYAFSICCIEILGMGDLPYGHRDDKHVALLVLEQDKRAEIPFTPFTPLVEALIQECWVLDPEQRPAFGYVAATLKRLRKRQGAVESPVPVQPDILMEPSAWSQPHHLSPDMRPPELPEMSASTLEDVQIAPGIEASSEAVQGVEPLSDDADSMSTPSCGSQPKPFQPIGRPCSNPSHHHCEPTVNPETGLMEMPSGRYSVTVIYTPSRQSSMVDSDTTSTTSSHLTSSLEAEHIVLEGVQHHLVHHTHHVGSEYESPLPMDEHLVERRNEWRFRSLARSSHKFHHSLTLPLWSPSHVELGAVGYLSKPKGQFITLFNAMQPQHTARSKVTNIPSLSGYGPIRTGQKFGSQLTVTQRGRDLFSGLLTFGSTNDGRYSEHISRRHSFPLRAGRKAAYICVERTMYQFIEDLTAPREWFKANVKSVIKEYAPNHPIQKEDVVVVVGTLCAPEYALFVSHSHPNGQAHFNVFSDRKSGQPWGTFTTDTEYPSDEGGPSYVEEIMPPQAMFANKVSSVRLNAGSSDAKDWDALMLARLRFPTDATEPTLQ